MNVCLCKQCHDKATRLGDTARDTFISVCQAFLDRDLKPAWLPPYEDHSDFCTELLIKVEWIERLGWVVTHETDKGIWVWPKYMHKKKNKEIEHLNAMGFLCPDDDLTFFCIEGGHLGLARQ